MGKASSPPPSRNAATSNGSPGSRIRLKRAWRTSGVPITSASNAYTTRSAVRHIPFACASNWNGEKRMAGTDRAVSRILASMGTGHAPIDRDCLSESDSIGPHLSVSRGENASNEFGSRTNARSRRRANLFGTLARPGPRDHNAWY